MQARALLIFLVLFAAAVSCKKHRESDKGVDCASVGVRLVDIAQAEASALRGREKTVFETQIHLIEDHLVATCKLENWPASRRACLVAATDKAGFDACAGPPDTQAGNQADTQAGTPHDKHAETPAANGAE